MTTRNKRVAVHFTREELKLFKKRARENGYASMARYMREVALTFIDPGSDERSSQTLR